MISMPLVGHSRGMFYRQICDLYGFASRASFALLPLGPFMTVCWLGLFVHLFSRKVWVHVFKWTSVSGWDSRFVGPHFRCITLEFLHVYTHLRDLLYTILYIWACFYLWLFHRVGLGSCLQMSSAGGCVTLMCPSYRSAIFWNFNMVYYTLPVIFMYAAQF